MRQNTIGAKQVSELITKAAVLARGSGSFVSRGWTRVILPAVLAATGSSAFGGPEGATVVRGDVNITKVGNQTVIQASDRAIINYRSFDIGSAEAVRFIQPGANARVLNRIDGAAPTRIDGALMANGRVYIINPAGVIFGAGARVNVAGLYAAGGHLSDSNFINGVDRFTDVRGAVENHGAIEAQAAALIGSRVANTGQIVAPQGTVVMASGNDVLIGEQGGNIYVRVSGEAGGGDTKRAATENTGTITADRGQVVLGAGDMLGLAIRNAGSIKAKNVTVQGQGTGTVMVAGTIDVSNQADSKAGTGDCGGRVEITGQNVGLDNATINASGTHAGGTVLIGGDEHGEGDVAHAERVFVNSGSQILADATELGQGGKVVLWSDQWTGFGGEISARGGAVSGDGGFIETSSKKVLTVEGARVNASSVTGKGGMWLLDPTDVTLSTGATANMGGSPTFTPTANPNTGNVQISTIVTALKAGSNVSISTTSGGAGPEEGSIRINNAIAVDLDTAAGNQNVSLTLNADSFIVVGGAISATGTGTDTLSVIMNSGITGASANKTITVNQAISTVNNGAITLNASGGLVTLAADLNAGTGAVNITGAGVTQSSGGITGGTLTLNGTGAFTVNSGTNAFSTLAGTMNGATNIATTSGLTLTGTVASGGGAIAFTAAGVNQTSGAIGGGALTLAGTGTFNLSSATNTVTSIGGTVTGALTLVNNAALQINTLDSQINPISVSAGTNLLTIAGDILSGTSSIVLTADTMSVGGGVTTIGGVGATVTLRPSSAGQAVFLGDSGAGLSLSAADLLKVTAASLVIGNTNSTATTTLSQAAGGLDLSSKSYTLTVNSGTITSNQLTTAAAVTYNLGVAAAGTLNLNQAITTGGAAITINGGTAGDTFNLGATAASNAVSVNGAGGIDTFNVGATNSVAGLLGNVAINGGGNADILNYNDSAQTGATYTVNASGIQRASGAFVSFSNMGAGTVTLNAGNSGGTGANTINIANLAAGPSFVANGGGGNDTFRIGGTADTLGNLSNIAASITVNGGTGTNDIRVDDGASATTRTYSIGGAATSFGTGVSISHDSSIQQYSLFASAPGNTINVTDTIAARTFFRINGGAGADIVNVGSVGNDLVGLLGVLDVQAGGGANVLNVNDQGNAGAFTYTVAGSGTSGSITRGSLATISFDNNMATVALNTAAGANTVNVTGTIAGAAVTVNGGAAADTFNVGSGGSVSGIGSALTLNGGGSSDVLNYNDASNAAVATYTVSASSISRAGSSAVNYATTEAVNLNGGSNDNTFNVNGTASIATTTLTGGAGNDTFNIGGTLNTLGAVAGNITVAGGTGSNAININDSSNAAGTAYAVTSTTLTRAGAGTTTYDGTTQTIGVNTGSGADTVTVGTAGSLDGLAAALTVTGGGNTTLTLDDSADASNNTYGITTTQVARTGGPTIGFATIASLNVNSGTGTDIFNTTGGLTASLNGGTGTNTLNFNDSASSANNTYTFTSTTVARGGTVTYSNMNAVNATLGSGVNAAFIQSAGTPLTITAGNGNTNFFVDSNSGAAGGTVDNITALLTLNGGSGTNNLVLTDRDDVGATADTVSLSGSSIGAGGGDSFFGAGGSITFSNLASITIFAGSNLTIANGATLGANTLIDTKASTNRNFSAGSVDGAFALTVDAGTANAAFDVLGGSTPLTGFSSTSALNILNGNITTASGGGGITLVGATRLDASVTLTSNDTGITTDNVNALAAGTQGLTLVAGTGDIVLGNLGATTRLGAFQITSVNDLTAGSITATRITQLAGAGTSTFASALNTSTAQGIQLTGNIFVITGGADTRTAGTGDGIFSVTSTGGAVISTADLDLGGTFTKAGAGDLSLGANITTANGSILVNGGNVTLTAASTLSTNGGTNPITFAGGVALAGNNLTLVSDNTVSRFNGGANSVTGNGAGVLTIRPSSTSASIGVAGGAGTVVVTTTDLDALANNAAARIDIGTASTGTHNITVGASTFRDPVRFLAPGAGGQVNFTGNVTGLTNASITAIGPAAIGLSADIVTAGSAITLTGPVTVTGNRLLDTTAGGTVTAGADIAVSGATEGSALNNDSLTMQAGTTGGVSTSTIGLATSLLNLTIGSSATANTGSITAQGIAVTSNSGTHNLLSAGSDGISLTGGSFTLNAGADTSAGGTMQVQNTGLLTIVGPINLDGFFRQGTALGIPGGTSLNGNVTTTGDEITFAGPVTLLGATRTFTSAGGNVTFSGLVTGPSQMVISAGAGDVRLAGATTVDGGFSSTGAGFDNSGALITTVNQNVTVNHTGAITLGNGVNAGSGLVSLTGSQITQNGAIISGGYTANAAGNIAINAFIRGDAGGIDVRSGTSGTGNISFGGGTIDLFADTISLRAGDGVGGAGTASQVLANGAGVIFHGTSSGNSPVNLTLRSDGNIDDTTTPAAGQYANTPAGVNLTLISDDGSVTITDGARVAGTNLALTGATGITLGGSVAPNTLTLNSATTAGGDIITNGDLTIGSTLGLVGGSHELRSDTGVIFINAAVSAGASDLTLSAREIQVNAAVNGAGTLVIQPVAPGANILLASTALNGAAIADAVLDLSAAEIANFSNGFSSITIGRSNGTGAISTAGALTFLDPVTLRSPTGTIAINDALTGLDNASFAMVAGSHTLAANITTNGNAVSFDNALVLNNSVAIDTTNAGAVAGGANVAFGGTVNGDATANERSLTVNAGTAGIISTGGSIGSAAGTLLHNLTLTASSNTIGGGVATSGFQSVTGATTVSGDITTDTSGATGGALASILYANALSITTDTTIRSQGAGLTDTIQLMGGIASVGAKHAIIVNSGTSTTTTCGTIDGSNVQFLSPLVLCNDTTVNATVAAVFNSTIDSQVGPFFLTVNSPATTFGGNIGTGTNGILSALTTDAGGTLTINAGIINTTGQQTFNDATTLGSALVATSTTQGVSFLNGVNAQSNAITVNGPGTGAFVGGIANASTVTTDAGGSTQISGSVAATGAVAFGDRLLLTGDTTVNGSSINLFGADSNTATPNALAATTAGAFTLGNSGQTNALTSTNVTAATITLASVQTTTSQSYTGATSTNGTLRSTTSGPIQINGALTLAGDTTIRTAGAASSDDISISGTVQSPGTAFNLTLTSGAGDVLLASDVGGGGNALASLTAQGNTLTLRNVTTTGNQVFTGETGLTGNLFSTGTGSIAVGGNLTLGSDSTISTNNGSVVFGRTVNSDSVARNLTVNTGGSGLTRFVGAVGNNNRLQTLTTNGDGTARFEGSQVRTIGAQSYSDAVTLGNNVLFEGTNLTFGSTVDSDGLATARTLTANTSGSSVTAFVGSVGSTIALNSIITNADGSTVFQNGAKTTGAMTFNDATTLVGTFDAGGAIFFASTAKLGGSIATNIAASGGLTFTGAATVAGTTVLDSRASTIFFRSTIDADASATDPLLSMFSGAVATADVTPFKFNGEIGVTKRLGGLVLGPDLSATPLAATIGFNKGGYNAAGQMLVSSTNITNLLRIVTGPQGFRMGTRQKLTAFGQLQINTTGEARLSDITSLASISVQAGSIVVQLRPGGSLLDNKFETPVDTLDADGGVDFVARDTIAFSVVPTTVGSGFPPSFATDTGTPGLNTSGFVNRQFTNGVATRLFTDPRTSNTTLLALDLKGLGPSIANTATSLAGAIPRDSETREIATPVTVSDAVERVLKEMGIEINRLGMQDLVAFLVGRSLYQDQPLKAKPSAERGDYRVTINRLTQSTAEAVVEAYNDLAFETTTNDKGEQVRVKRTEAIAEDIGDAWDRYSETTDEPTGAGFRTWLESLGEKATDRDKAVLADLNKARVVLQRLDYLGLSPFESSIPKRQLLGDIKPNGMTSKQMEEAVLGTAPVASKE